MLKMYILYILSFLSNIQILLNIFEDFVWFLKHRGVQGYLKHSSVIFPVKITTLFLGIVFSWETRWVDPKAAAPNFRRRRSRCILWIPIMGFQGQGRGVAVHERWMVDEASNFHCLVEYCFGKGLELLKVVFFGVGGGWEIAIVCLFCFFRSFACVFLGV